MIFRSINYWLNSLPTPPSGISPVLFYLPIFAIALFILVGLIYKPFLLQFMPTQLRFQTVDAARVPKLDRDSLQRLTQEFEAAGFVQLGDITNTAGIAAFNDAASGDSISGDAMSTTTAPVLSPTPAAVADSNYTIVPGFCRVFGHPQYGCYADLHQHFPPGGTPTPFSWAISSELESGWDVTTSSRRPEAIFYLLRRRQGARYTHQGMRPVQLLQTHLAERLQLQNELGLNVLNKSDLQSYVTAERRVMGESREVLMKKNSLGALLEVLSFMASPKNEWRGEQGVKR